MGAVALGFRMLTIMTYVETWTFALVILAGALQGGGLGWAWAKAKRNARAADQELEGAIAGEHGHKGSWEEFDYMKEHQKSARAQDALDAYKVQGVLVLTGIVAGVAAGALPLMAS